MSGSKLSDDNDLNITSRKLYVKYMVSLRCKTIVKSELENLSLDYKISVHGGIEFTEEFTEDQYDQLNKSLKRSGMVLLNSSESVLIDKIITTIVEVIHYTDSLPKLNFRDLINKYAVPGEEPILKIFSDVKGMSVLQFIIIQKIERAKELLLYDDMPLSEIAQILNYKNKNYLLAQFKKTTGLTPSDFKHLKKERRKIAEEDSNSAHSEIAGLNS